MPDQFQIRSGSARMHPYNPVGEAMRSSSFEYVPSVVNRAASESGVNESMEVTPMPRSFSAPSILNNPLHPASVEMVGGLITGL